MSRAQGSRRHGQPGRRPSHGLAGPATTLAGVGSARAGRARLVPAGAPMPGSPSRCGSRDCGCRGWPSRTPAARVVPFARGKPPVPGEQGRRRGTRQDRRRYTPGPSQVTGDRPGREPFGPGAGPVTGQREPRHPDPVRPAAPGRGCGANHPRCLRVTSGSSGPAPRVRVDGARLAPDLATERGPRPGITGDLPVPGTPITGPDGCPCQGSERFGEPLAPAWLCPPYVRNHCRTATSADR
jgi:hypothetical protein